MKAKWFLISAIALLTGISIVSCSDDDEELKPVFPESTPLDVVPGGEYPISFDANMDWALTIGSSWVTFVNGEDEIGQSDRGLAGKVSRTIRVRDTNWGFDPVDTNITLTMGGESKVIYTIARAGKERVVKMYTQSEYLGPMVEITEINLQYQSNGNRAELKPIGFVANFDWRLVLPEEATLSVNEMLTGLAKDINELPKQSDLDDISIGSEFITSAYTGKVTIQEANGDFTKDFVLTYPGMGDEDLFYVTNNRFNLVTGIEFTKEGFFIEKRGSTEMITEDRSVNFLVRAKDMAFSHYLIGINDQNQPEIIQSADTWAEVNQTANSGEFEVSISGDGVNDGAPRTLYFLALPESMAAGTPDLAEYFSDSSLTEAGTKYGIRLSQRGEVAATGFSLNWGLEGAPSITVMDAGSMAGQLGHGAPANNTYQFGFTEAMTEFGALQIFPNGWPGLQTGFVYKLEVLDGDWSQVNPEPYINSQGLNGITLNNLSAAEGAVLVLFYNTQADKDNEKPMGALFLMKD